jgi:hypothetical protein
MFRTAPLVLVLLALLAPCAASATEADYGLSCGREVLDAGRATSRPALRPVSARIHFTGGSTPRVEADGSRTVYLDLVLAIGGSRTPGGAVEGSSFGSSTTFDGPFRRTGEGSTVWAFSRGFGAFTLRHEGRWYICEGT